METLHTFFVVLFGLAYGASIGSFLGMLAYRLPLAFKGELSATHKNWLGRSACTYCQSPIPLKNNIPIISFLMLKAKTQCCAKPLSAHYFYFEIFCAVLGVALALYFFV